jgi:putative Mg2+ transporter-C (MgtC) family protein
MTCEYILSIFIAAILGGAIGLEREYRSKEAGFRTHFLVGLGSGLFMILSVHGFDEYLGMPGIQRDPSRLAAQVVSGIGFIGAGCIIFQKNANAVKGLTTAAGLWVTSAIGMTAGRGMYAVAAASTLMVLVCLEGMNFIHHKIFKHQHREYDADDHDDQNTK